MDLDQAREYARGAMPQVVDDLRTLVGHASVAFPGFPPEPMAAIADDLLGMFRRAGVEGVRLLDLGEGAYPTVFAEIPGPEGAPVVTLYAHYDVQPAAQSQGWTTDPWTLTEKPDGRLYGRGSSDDKSGVVAHLATLARIDLSDAELDHLAPQLSVILESVASITGVAGDDVPPTSHAIPLTNVFREDVVVPGLTAEQALAMAPQAEEQRFAVPRILGDEQ